MKQSQSLKQALTLVLIALWVLSLGYYPIRQLHYTLLDALQTSLFDWKSGIPWWSRLILGLPMLSLIVMTLLYLLRAEGNPAIRPWMVRLSMQFTGTVYIAYNSFIFWGQDIASTFITFYLDVEYDALSRGLQWILGENFLWTHGINLAFIFGFMVLNGLYRSYSEVKAKQPIDASFPLMMPPIPLIERPPTMPLIL